jgi:hypothetical protein
MKTVILGTTIIVVLTLASGVMQGKLSNRWGVSDHQRLAGDKLASFPETFGDWVMKASHRLDQDAVDQLEPYGYFQREYVNRTSGAAVYVTALLGPAGPISVHTPEVCYAGRDHRQIGERQRITIPGHDGDDFLWKTSFRLHGVDAQEQNIYYAWSVGGHWIAPDSPRLSFAAKPYLYKIQLSTSVRKGDGDSTSDPAPGFAAELFPALKNYMQTP